MNEPSSVLLIFTGGTISMAQDPATGALRPLDFKRINDVLLPELKPLGLHIDSYPFEPFIDSSDMQPSVWKRLAEIVRDNYDRYDGFVILHGTDTMAFTASALSFMLRHLSKPVILTGSQLPLGVMRSDAKENLLTSIEMATAKVDGRAAVPEVCIFFEDTLLRGNRTTKINSEHFNAFRSFNYPPLARAGVHIKYDPHLIRPYGGQPLELRTQTNQDVAILKLFPGITLQMVDAILNIKDLKAVVLETYGSGNAPQQSWLHQALKQASERGLVIVNKTQCSGGSVEMGRYETSLNLVDAGVISGYDITTEAAVTKLMHLLGEHPGDPATVRHLMQQNLCGEITL